MKSKTTDHSKKRATRGNRAITHEKKITAKLEDTKHLRRHLGRIRAKHMRKLYKRLISDTILKDRMAKGTKRKLVWKKDKTKRSKMEENEEEPTNEVEEGRKEEKKVTPKEGGESEDEAQVEKGLNEPLGDLSIDENENSNDEDSDTSDIEAWIDNSSGNEAEDREEKEARNACSSETC